MKKLLFLLSSLFIFSTSVFAFDANIEIGVNIPVDIGAIQISKTKLDGTTVTLKDNQGGILIGGFVGADLMFNDIIGIGLDMSLNGSPYYSKPIFAKLYQTEKNSFFEYEDYVSIHNPDWNKNDKKNHKYYMFNMSYFIGPAIRLINSEKLSFIFTPGLEYDYKYIMHFANNIFDSYYTLSELGTGIDLRLAFKLNDVVAINLGSLFSFSFFQGVAGAAYRKTEEKTTTYLIANTNLMYNFKYTPRFGITFFF